MIAANRPGDRIWELLSGVPPRALFRRFFVALQAYIDDSGRGQEPAFVLAGYIARPDVWCEFSKEWEAVKHAPRHIDYFKMRHAWYFKGDFEPFNTDERNKKVADLYAVIEQYVMKGVAIIIPVKTYKTYAKLINHPKAADPYFLAAYFMMVQVAQEQDIMGISEPVDFIFDHQEGMSGPVQDAWDALKSFAPPFVAQRLGKRPGFEDDKLFMPLQAADLHAWWVRRLNDDHVNNKPLTPFMWKDTRRVESLHMRLEDSDLEEFFATIATGIRSAISFEWEGRRFIQYSHWRHAVERSS